MKRAHRFVSVGLVLPSLERPEFEISNRSAVDDPSRLTAQMLQHIRGNSGRDRFRAGRIEGESIANRESPGNGLQERIKGADAVAVREAFDGDWAGMPRRSRWRGH